MDKPKILTLNEKIDVVYCIDLWVRDLQMRLNLPKIKERLQPATIKSDEPVAIVGYGPSLNDTWEELKDFKIIISTSGAHKFLTERGIIPTYHIDVDPREHKIGLIGTPNKETTYLLASCIHPKYIDFLQEHECKTILWHVFANGENGETCSNIFPRGEWCLTGGSDIFLRALTIARFLGYTNLHAFGKDGCISDVHGNHAAAHPNQPKDHCLLEYNGKTYKTTSAYLACTKQLGHELDQMPDLKLTMHGEGLAQELFKSYIPEPVAEGKAIIAIKRPELMSDEYRELNKKLHESNQFYGVSGVKRVDIVKKLYEGNNFKSCLDYGSGKGLLAHALDFPIWEYDPCIPGKDTPPRPADLVVCTDVLEHIEPEYLPYVLDDLRRCTLKVGYFTISTRLAGKILADGRNAHLIVKDKNWWKNVLSQFFEVGKIFETKGEIQVIVSPKKSKGINDFKLAN